jgi:hypothetical protein
MSPVKSKYITNSNCQILRWIAQPQIIYEGNSKINLRSAGKKKRVVIAPKPPLSSNN